MKLLKRYFPVILFFILSLVIVVIWFSSGTMLAGGEEGIPFYDAERMVNLYSSPWYETGTGYLIPVIIPRFPLFFVLQFFQVFQRLHYTIQPLVYFFLLFSGLFSMYLLCRKLFGNSLGAFSASLFYFFNLYSTTQVWGRFLLTNIFAWAYLPLVLFLWIQILEEKKIKWLLIFLISSLVYCYSYGMPSNVIVLWILLLSFLFVKFYHVRRSFTQTRRLILISCISIICWFIVNGWWLFPYFSLSGLSFSTLTDAKSNLDSLVGVSQYFPNKVLFLLRQNFLMGQQSFLFSYYSSPLVYLGSLFILFIVFYGILKARRNKFFLFLIITFIIAWFMSKGTNPPLGHYFYSFLFHNFSFTTALRNSYEKVGILFVLFYAIFFGVGIQNIYNKTRNKILIIAILVGCVILVWPLWKGKIFKNFGVVVPENYREANIFLNSQEDGRVLMLPIIPGDSVQYEWQGGSYTGLEPGEFLFDRPVVSKIVRTPYFDPMYLTLYNKFTNNQDYNLLLDKMNISHIILHEDINSEASGASTSAQVKATLNNNPRIKLLKKFGELSIYKYKLNDNRLFVVSGKVVPIISYKKINNTLYHVYIVNATKPYDLIFKVTYNDFWRAKISNNTINHHKLVDEFLNMWHIGKKGTYIIEVSL